MLTLFSVWIIAHIVFLVIVATLHVAGRRALAGWLFALLPACNCIAILMDLAKGSWRLGLAAIADDQRLIAICLVQLAVVLLVALRPNWKWLFWVVWTVSAGCYALLLYALLTWHLFQ
jgi:hypothetical protein